MLEQDAAEKLRLLRLELAGRENCITSGFKIYIPKKNIITDTE